MTLPSIKKNADGTWTVVGIKEQQITQSQADYEELVKAAGLIPGDAGDRARALLQDNPGLSGGMLASLVKNGAMPNNSLAKSLIDIDKFTQAERAKNAFEEAQRVANEKFSNSWRGKLWKYVKGFTRTVTIASETPFELLGAGLRKGKAAIDAVLQGDFSGEKTGFKTGDEARRELLFQTKAGQIGKAIKEGKSIDFGQGFFPSEETGLGFAARQEKMKTAKVLVKLDNGRTYERPYSFADPIIELIPGIEPDTKSGTVLSAIGDLVAMIKLDFGFAYAKAKATRDALARTARISKGKAAAVELAAAEARLDELVAQTQEARRAWEASTGLDKTAKEVDLAKAIEAQLQYTDEYGNLLGDPTAIAEFLNSKKGLPIIDELAAMDWKQIYDIGKKSGKRRGFNVDQAKDLAAASTREDVLAVLAKYINSGEVVADALETGTKVGNALRGVVTSRLVPGKTVVVANKIKGLAAEYVAKTPHMQNTLNAFRRVNDTIIEQGRLVHAADKDALVEAIRNYGGATKLDQAVIDDLVSTVVYSDSSYNVGFTATAKLFDAIFDHTSKLSGVDVEALKEVTTVFKERMQGMASYWANRHGQGDKIDYVFSNGKKITLEGPHLDSEMLNSTVYLPPVQDILDLVNRVARTPGLGKAGELTKEGVDFITNNVWKRLVLVRPAYILRNIAEEQIRVLGTGHISIFNHPITAIAMWLGRPSNNSKFRRVLHMMDPFRNTIMNSSMKLGSAADEFAYEAAAHDALDASIAFISSKAVSGVDKSDISTVFRLSGVTGVPYGHEQWWNGLATEIRKLHNSIQGRAVARTAPGYEQETIEYLLRGEGKGEWTEFAKAQKDKETGDWLLTDEGAMMYLFTGKNGKDELVSLRARIEEAAGSGGEASQMIKNLIAYGKINIGDTTMIIPKGMQSAENSIKNSLEFKKNKKALKDANEEFAQNLKNTFETKGTWDNVEMNVPVLRYRQTRKEKDRINKATDWFFDVAVKFETQTTMGPEWRQKYWDAINDIAAALDADAVVKLREAAQNSLTPLQNWLGVNVGKNHPVWKALGFAEDAALQAGKAASLSITKYTDKFPNVAVYKDGGSGGLIGSRSTVGFVNTSVLKDMAGNFAKNDEAIKSYRQALREGKGFAVREFDGKPFNDPIMVVYDNETGLAYVGEGNHRLQAALAEGIEYVPVRVVKGYADEMVEDATKGRFPKQIKNNKDIKFYDSTSGKPVGPGYVPPEMHPSFVFDKNLVLEATGKEFKQYGNVTTDMAHKYAAEVANKHVRDLFYDASRRRLLFHQWRLALPFGQAWEDTIRAWSKIALNNPMQVYKVAKPLQWLTKPESSALYQLTDAKDYYDPNQGFFYTDPKDGQRKFFLPFAGTGLNFLSNLVLGKPAVQGPFAVSATPQSLNFAFASGSIIPGVGPGVSMTIAALDNAGMNPLKLVPVSLREKAYNFIFPFGDPDFKQGFIEAFLPNNWRRIMAPWGNIDAAYASAFAPTMNYLASGGNYDLYDEVDRERLLRDTDKFSKWFTFWRGFTGLFSPFPMQFTGITTLDDGNVMLNTELYNSFKNFEVAAAGDKTKAYKDFMDFYGVDKIFSIISVSSGGPTNLYTYEMIQKDPEVVDLYPDTYGYAYPGGGYSQQLYRWQRKFGNKTALSKDDLLSRATSIMYNAAYDTMLAKSTGEGWDSEQFDEASRNLRKVFYGAGIKRQFDVDYYGRVKEQLRKMAVDERFNDSEAVQGLRDYLYLRDEAVKAYGGGTDSLKSKAALGQREWLAGKAKEIIKKYPDFQNMFYSFFKNELEGN